MTITIKNRYYGTTIYASETATTIREAVEEAAKAGVGLPYASLHDTNLQDVDLSGANLPGANLSGANLSGADLPGANLHRADLHGADLHDANLTGANLYDANLRRVDLDCVNLVGADLTDTNLRGASLFAANLFDANLSGANLRGGILSGANLSGANFTGADLSGADLARANLSGTVMPDGRPWEEYRQDHLAGICQTEEVREKAVKAWGNHTWNDCPMHKALGIDGVGQAENPKLVGCWVTLYDAGRLDKPADASNSPNGQP